MDDRRLLLFFAISLAIYVGWYALVGPPPSPQEAGPGEPVAEAPAPVAEARAGAGDRTGAAEGPEAGEEAGSEAEETGPPVSAESEERIVIAGPGYRVVFTNRGGQLLSFRLEEHRTSTGEVLDLVRDRADGPWPLGLVDAELEPHPLNEALFAVRREQLDGSGEMVTFEYRGPLGDATKSIRLDGRTLEADVFVRGDDDWGLVLGPGIRNPEPEEMKGRYRAHSAVYRLDGEVETVNVSKANELQRIDGAGLSWVGLEDTYFLTVLIPEEPMAAAILEPVTMSREGEEGPFEYRSFRSEEALDEDEEELPRDIRVLVVPGSERLAGHLFFGAKEYEVLAELPWRLEETVEWGWFGILARPLLIGLEWIHDNVVPNYGWAIVIMTVLLKLVLFPLTHKSHVSMRKMQKLQPQMKAIRQKWRGKLKDKKGKMNLEAQRKMNEEIQELFRAEGASPYGGCLPILLQIPVFFAFFRLLLTAVELRQEPWLLWLEDLSAPDPIYILPVVMGATQIYQQRLTPAAADPMQRRIMQLFPWMFTIFALGFPSGLVLYWTVNNALTIVQTGIFNRLRGDDGEKDGKKKGKRSDNKKKKKG